MTAPHSLSIIPKPAEIHLGEGVFEINAETKIYFQPQTADIRAIAEDLAYHVTATTGLALQAEPFSPTTPMFHAIVLKIQPIDTALGLEGYQLTVHQNAIEMIAHQPAGLFYAVQTLRQLVASEPEGQPTASSPTAWRIPCLNIFDRPRFAWRGMLLDCCRHFMTKDFVKRYIDLLAYHKMNRFHWHLTEDQGWRIEIKKYPKLTEVGAWRKYEDGTVHGGFYTQEDIKEVVAYAQQRFITVIPEIELPGHCQAALACYPELSCTGGPFDVSTRWGVHKDVYCAGNEATFQFLEDVLGEVVDLFPAPYIHIGGDEVPKDRWEKCPKCQARKSAESLGNEHELQSYFIKRIEQFLLTKNRRIIGWDEILEGGLAPGATVQSWRGMEGATAAASAGHDAIVSPTSHAYFDYPIETLDLRQVYSFEPIPSGLSTDQARHILGGECNMWTEYAPQETIDSKMFPRLLAMSEVLWSPREGKNYHEFHRRVRRHYPRLERLGVQYGPESRPISILPAFDPTRQEFRISLESGEAELEIHYTLDGSSPTLQSKRYLQPLTLKQSALIRAQAFRDGEPYGVPTEKQFIFHLATGKSVQLRYSYSPKYAAAGNLALTDGITGSLNFRDGFWQGFEQDDLEAIIDLGKIERFRKIGVTFLQNAGSWIFMPRVVEYGISDDGDKFETVARVENDIPTDYPEAIIKEFKAKVPDAKARYIKIFAQNIGVCPPNHPGAGGKAWLFVDEIVVR
ncbi:MAG: glycoside hydrolase family 20 protein [candidate division KSB1 bacterium]|nr:glycoside hydrolase family 20 protein [candidate division KSB1 bacterium]MDZ7341157.1 glycoside hydrolase family 20 protein [candidate division KSB1 bacterium]